MAMAADDEMVVQRNAERLGDLGDGARHRDVGGGGGRVAGGVVMDQSI